jgi:ribosomal protein S27E
MEINCISCGHRVELGEAYDDYDGQVKCWVCGANLAIKTDAGAMRAMQLANGVTREVVHTGSPADSQTATE